jgi:G1/S-specific cyclin-D2
VVLPLAVAYLDRVLASKFVPRRNLQALGSACLLLASKMKAPQPMVAARLSELTAGNVNAEEMLDWVRAITQTIIQGSTSFSPQEMVVVNQLQWNLLQATPFEFFDQLLVRSPILEALREDFARCLHSMQKGGR